MTYRLSLKAEDDVINIFIYSVETFGIEKADQYHSQLERGFKFLSENSKVAHLRTEITPPVRVHPIGSHLAIYLISEHGDIEIIRVRHAHEEWLNLTPY